ncbi:MAG: xanthine dehydrogenase family protein molybdopterin-binding subunit [bacterium]|nr:xanthine dehydrogenase family protein molybdopterin-binding subunit [bacterium]
MGRHHGPAPADGAPWVGRPVRRREDPRFLRGQARYLADISLAGMLHLVVVRSPHAHARLLGIRTEAALRSPGVVSVVTAAELAGRVGAYPIGAIEGARAADTPHPLLADGKVRYVGEPVAAVLADSRAAAVDAAELVEAEYDPLPALVDPTEALGSAVLVHEKLGENVVLRWERTGGDVEGAFQAAARVVSGKFDLPRLIAAPIEARGTLASYEPGTDLLTVWCSAQDPHRPLAQLSQILGRPEDRIRLVVPDVGGAFGSKGIIPPEGALAAWLAIRIGRPVRWVEDRRENFLAAYQGRGLRAELEMAVTASGKVLGVRANLISDAGAYLYPATALSPVTAGMLLTGAYAIPAASVKLVGTCTNKAPGGQYRGAGRPEAAYLVERMMDLVAGELEIDPVEVRRRNLIPPESFPYRTPLGFVYDSGNYGRALDRACELVEYDAWRDKQRLARAEGRLLGIGLALYVERAGSQFWESGACSVRPDGRVVVRTGSCSHGQGHETTFAQIAADVLQVDLSAIVVEYGDTAVVPRGVGTFGSRSTAIGGSAVLVAVQKVKAKAGRIAAHLLEAAEADIEWSRGQLRVRGAPGRAISWKQVAASAYQPSRLPPDIEVGLDAVATFRLAGPVFPFGVYAAVVEIDRITGHVHVLRLVAVDDAGTIVNPLLAEGQVIGAVAQGLGQVLSEQAIYDAEGQLLTGTFADYPLLRAHQATEVTSDFLETPSPLNPLGAKGVGEAGTIGTPPAVANAVADALAPLGIRHVDMPLTPEKMWRLVGDTGASPR